MNFYNPYFNTFPAMGRATSSSPGLFGKLFGNINLSSILSGTGKVVNFANQAIPLVKQMSPLVKNAKTMFKLMNEFKKVDEPKTAYNEPITNNLTDSKEDIEKIYSYDHNGPTFFI